MGHTVCLDGVVVHDGGEDGPTGMFEVTRTGSVCETPGTTAPPTTVAPAAIVARPATPVLTQPTYTGRAALAGSPAAVPSRCPPRW